MVYYPQFRWGFGETAAAKVLKTFVERRVGSIPTGPTILTITTRLLAIREILSA